MPSYSPSLIMMAMFTAPQSSSDVPSAPLSLATLSLARMARCSADQSSSNVPSAALVQTGCGSAPWSRRSRASSTVSEVMVSSKRAVWRTFSPEWQRGSGLLLVSRRLQRHLVAGIDVCAALQQQPREGGRPALLRDGVEGGLAIRRDSRHICAALQQQAHKILWDIAWRPQQVDEECASGRTGGVRVRPAIKDQADDIEGRVVVADRAHCGLQQIVKNITRGANARPTVQ
eukprot:m.184150 g.184150  ORF g.184150 m.184150 type:complete len:231 (+) comp10001_c0_seq56:731-1423(+)